jgi:arginyl-tRNA synthetase
LEKSGQSVNNDAARFDLLTHESEIAVIKEIAKLDLVVEDAARSLSPKSLARYAYSLATTFNVFYEKVPVLKEENADVRMARLALVRAFGVTLKNALVMLGITALKRM